MDFLLKRIEQILRYQKRWKKWQKVVASLACVVVFITTYALILPAITMDRDEAQSQGGIFWEESQEAEETVASADEQGTSQDGILSAEEASLSGEPVEDGNEELVTDDYEQYSSDGAEEQVGTGIALEENLAEGSTSDTGMNTEKPAAVFDEVAGDMTVHVEAPEGAFPAGTTMRVEPVADEQVMDAVQEAVEEAVTRVSAVDIIFLDTLGNEIEPEAEIRVSMSSSVMENVEQPVIVHVDEEGVAETVESEQVDGSVVFESDRFSVYVLVETISTRVIAASGETYEISVSFGPEAQIPEESQLYASEITDEELHGAYMEQASQALKEKYGQDNLLSGRFFEIEIRNGEDIIEPKAPVTVTIEYVDPVYLNTDDELSAIHFGADGIELTGVEPATNENGKTEVVFEQSGFSVTGTIITSGTISNGNYCILYKNGNRYYALSNTGTAVEVSYENGVVTLPDTNTNNIIWTRTGQRWRGNKNQGYYLYLNNRTVYTRSANLTITASSTDETYKIRNGSTYLRFDNNTFTYGTLNSNNQMYLVRIDETTGTNIHYGYLGDEGNYVEWPDRLEQNIRIPDVFGDQYDVKADIEGYEYVTSRLKSATGKDINNLLGTDKGNGVNTGVTDNSTTTTATWKYRETTENNHIYDDWSGAGYDYNGNTYLNNDDIYVIYRKDNKEHSSPQDPEIEDVDAPKISKKQQNNDDGTYDIDLNITAEAVSNRKAGRANVVIVLDSSGSMDRTSQSGETLWTLATGAVKTLSTSLLGLNTTGDDAERVQFAFVNFSNYVKNENWIYSVGEDNKNQYIETNPTDFNNMIDTLRVHGGTCWDKAMAAASNVLWDDDDPVYVVFISDGDTNSRAYSLDTYDYWDGGTYSQDYNDYDYVNNPTTKLNVDSTIHFADIIKAKGGTIYTVGITGTGTLDNLYRLNQGSVNYISNPKEEGLHFDVSDSSGITKAFDSIKNDILSAIGYQNIEMTDGLTGMTSTALVNGTAGNFSYTIAKYTISEEILDELPEGIELGSKKDANGNITEYSRNNDDTYTKTVKTVTEGTKATVTKNSNGTLSVLFPGETTPDTVSQATYDTDSKEITWNLGENYQLRDGYTYTVSFTVWPNQASYDIIAALRNDLLSWENEETYYYVDENGDEQAIPFSDYSEQIVKAGNSYSLRSNVKDGNTVTYYKVSTQTLTHEPSGLTNAQKNALNHGETVTITEYDPDNPDVITKITVYQKENNGTYTRIEKVPGSTAFVNPDPMPLTGTTVSMTKKWEDSLNPSQLVELIESQGFDENNNPKYFVELNILEGETPYKSYWFYPVKQEGKYVWPVHTVNISPALLVSELPEGKSASDYKTVTLNNTTYYVLNDGHTYNITESNSDYHFEFQADPYHPALVDSVLTNVAFVTDEQGAIISGTEATIREDVPVETIEARNSLTSELDITKKVQDNTHTMSQAEMDAETFTYKVTLTIPYTAQKPDETEEPFNYAKYMNAFEFVPRYNDSLDRPNRYIIHGYQNEDGDKGFNDDVTYFNGKVHGRYTVSYPGGTATLDEIFTPDQSGDGTQTGSIYVTLKRNEVLRFTNLPYGTEYAIEEVYANMKQADPSKDADAIPSDGDPDNNLAAQGYTSVTVKTKHGEDTGTVTGNRVEGTISALNSRFYNQFTNVRTRVTNDVYAEFKVKKVVDGYEWGSEYYNMRLTAGVATYTDSEGGTSTSPMPGLDSVNIYNDTDSHTLSFGNVLYTRPGVYKYTVSEYNNSANMPYVVFADPVEVTVTVTADNNGKLHVTEVTDNSGIENNSVLIPATQTSLDTVLTTMTNTSKPIDIVKVSGKTGNVIEGAVFEIHQGSEKLYFDGNGQALSAEQVLSRISPDGSITDISSEAAIRAMTGQGIKSTITIGEMSLKGLAVTGYTYTDGEFIENTPIVYELVEIKAADGFMITENNNYFKVAGIRNTNETTRVRYTGIAVRLTDADGHDLVDGEGNPKTTNKNVELSDNAMTITLENAPGAELPHTGGSGKLPYTLSGMILIFISALMYGFRMRRRERRLS